MENCRTILASLLCASAVAASAPAAAFITAQPLVDEDVLEPSVQNEVDHALGRAPTNEVAVSEASAAFASLWATNGASATKRAIALVSSQRADGRWVYMGKDVTPAAARLLRGAAGYPEPPPRLAIFDAHMHDISRQEGMPFAEVAGRIRAMGIEGVVLTRAPSAAEGAEMRRAGLAVACVVGWPCFEKGYDEAQCESLVALAVSNGCRQVMLVPGFYPSAEEPPSLFGEIVGRTRRFADMASARGVETLVEDFDDEKSPTFGTARTKAFLAAAPSVGFVYDTGNFIGRGDRAEDGIALLPRTRNFHIKDRPAGDSRGSCAAGSGSVPVAKIVAAARDAGYGGWFVIEHFGVTNMMECAASSAAYLRALR